MGIWSFDGTNNESYTQRALEHEGEHVPSQCFVVMRPNSRKVPKEARREKNTMLAVSHQHKSARGRADGNTCCATPVASLRKAQNRKTTGLLGNSAPTKFPQSYCPILSFAGAAFLHLFTLLTLCTEKKNSRSFLLLLKWFKYIPHC